MRLTSRNDVVGSLPDTRAAAFCCTCLLHVRQRKQRSIGKNNKNPGHSLGGEHDRGSSTLSLLRGPNYQS